MCNHGRRRLVGCICWPLQFSKNAGRLSFKTERITTRAVNALKRNLWEICMQQNRALNIMTKCTLLKNSTVRLTRLSLQVKSNVTPMNIAVHFPSGRLYCTVSSQSITDGQLFYVKTKL